MPEQEAPERLSRKIKELQIEIEETRERYVASVLQRVRELADEGKEFRAGDIDPETPIMAGHVLSRRYSKVYKPNEPYRLVRKGDYGNYKYFRAEKPSGKPLKTFLS